MSVVLISDDSSEEENTLQNESVLDDMAFKTALMEIPDSSKVIPIVKEEPETPQRATNRYRKTSTSISVFQSSFIPMSSGAEPLPEILVVPPSEDRKRGRLSDRTPTSAFRYLGSASYVNRLNSLPENAESTPKENKGNGNYVNVETMLDFSAIPSSPKKSMRRSPSEYY